MRGEAIGKEKAAKVADRVIKEIEVLFETAIASPVKPHLKSQLLGLFANLYFTDTGHFGIEKTIDHSKTEEGKNYARNKS